MCFILTPMSMNSESLEDYLRFKEAGDYHKEDLLRDTFENSETAADDEILNNALNRALYLEEIPLPESSIFDKNISVLTVDGDDLWLGSRSGDVARYSLNERSWRFFVTGQESLAIRSVQEIRAEGEYVWILSYGSVSLYSKRYDRYMTLNLPDNQTYRGLQSAVVLGQGLIVGTQNRGLRRIRLDGYSTIEQKPLLRNISYMQFHPEIGLLAGCEEQGLYLLDSSFQGIKIVENNRSTAAVRVVLGDKEQMIAGTYGQGLFKLVKRAGAYDIIFPGINARWITDGVELKEDLYCFSTLGSGLLTLDKNSMKSRSYGIEEGLGALDVTSLAYLEPFVVGAVQGQGLIKIHENYFFVP